MSGTKVGQFNLLCIVVIGNVGLGSDNLNLSFWFFIAAVELAFSNPSIGEQYQISVAGIIVSRKVNDQTFAHISIEIQVLALYRCYATFVGNEYCCRVAFAIARSAFSFDVYKLNFAITVIKNKHPFVEAQFWDY